MRLGLVLCVVLAFAACGDDDAPTDDLSGTSIITVTTLSPGDATIDAFEAPESVDCPSGPSTTVSVTYAVSNSVSQELLVDGASIPLPEPSGTVDAPVHCDELPHTFVLAATDAAGAQTVERLLVETVVP